MVIRFLQDVVLEVVETYDEYTDSTKTTDVRFSANDQCDVDFERQGNATSSFQFGDGSLACNVPNELFEIVSDED